MTRKKVMFVSLESFLSRAVRNKNLIECVEGFDPNEKLPEIESVRLLDHNIVELVLVHDSFPDISDDDIILEIKPVFKVHYPNSETSPSLDFGDLFKVAENILTGDRQAAYGSFDETYRRAAEIASGASGSHQFGPKDIVLVMIAVKLARQAHSYKRDNLIDLVNYVKILDHFERDKLLQK